MDSYYVQTVRRIPSVCDHLQGWLPCKRRALSQKIRYERSLSNDFTRLELHEQWRAYNQIDNVCRRILTYHETFVACSIDSVIVGNPKTEHRFILFSNFESHIPKLTHKMLHNRNKDGLSFLLIHDTWL